MTKMIFTSTVLVVNTDRKVVSDLTNHVEKYDCEFTNIENEFQIRADKIAVNYFGIDLFNSCWMHIEYITGKNIFTAKYRLYGDSNEDPQSKMWEKILIINATAFNI